MRRVFTLCAAVRFRTLMLIHHMDAVESATPEGRALSTLTVSPNRWVTLPETRRVAAEQGLELEEP